MIKVLIMDDEPYVREGLKHIIEWQENGFEICGDASDGDQGYEKILELRPDLVLIDIRMPGKTGLDIIKAVSTTDINVKFVIISGYSDFEYAKVAIRYGVKDYLLKPIDEDELLEVALKLKEEISNEKAKKFEVNINNNIIKEHKLRELILGRHISNIQELQQYMSSKSFYLATISFSKGELKADDLCDLEKVIRSFLSKYENIDVIRVANDITILFTDVIPPYVINILKKLKEAIDTISNEEVFIALGKEAGDIRNIAVSYDNAKALVENKFLFLELGVIYEKTLNKSRNLSLGDEDKLFSKVYSYMEIGEIDNIDIVLNDIAHSLRYKRYSEEQVKILFIRNLLEIKNKVRNDYNLSKEDIESNKVLIDNIYNLNSLDKICTFLKAILTDISGKIYTGTSENSIKRIVRYIDKNFNKELKLEYLAEIFNYNSAYLGKVFKSYTGLSFNVYLDKVRIEEAKKLLVEDELKVYQVCERVGYKNIDYFHSKFKKYVGISPLNYKKQYEKVGV